MKKKKVTTELDESIFPFIMYPKEYSSTIILTLFLCVGTVFIFYSLFTDMFSGYDYYALIIASPILLIMSMYCIAISYCLIKKTIFIEVSKQEIKLKRVRGIEVTLINDITYIYRKGGWKQGKNFILQCGKSDTGRYFEIPSIWFSEQEIMDLISLLMNINNNIVVNVASF